MYKQWILTVEEDENGDLILPLNDDILSEAGWVEGDTIEWIDNKDGSWTMKKKEETQWVLVECVSQFRQRYMVEVPTGKYRLGGETVSKTDWALDTVTMEEAKEFSQKHLGETIVSHRVISKEDALALCDQDNDYTSGWSDEEKMNAFFTTWEEQQDDSTG